MSKVTLNLGASFEVLDKHELRSALADSGGWEREAAFGLRVNDLPQLSGTPSGGALALGADQASGQMCGPKAGWYWAVHSITVDGLAAGDSVAIYKNLKFRGRVAYNAGGILTFGKGAFTLKSGDFIRLVATGLTTTSLVTMSGEYTSTPGPLMWKLL